MQRGVAEQAPELRDDFRPPFRQHHRIQRARTHRFGFAQHVQALGDHLQQVRIRLPRGERRQRMRGRRLVPARVGVDQRQAQVRHRREHRIGGQTLVATARLVDAPGLQQAFRGLPGRQHLRLHQLRAEYA
jgi:hypothetical protein